MKPQSSILVVDDNADLLNTFSLVLKRKGYDVDTAPDGLAAMDKFRSHHFDVVLMDIVMPGMSGVEVFHKIREIRPDAKVILMTAYYEEEEIRTALEQGVFSALHKPIKIARLMELIKEATLDLPILIVDDDPDFCQTMARVLEMKGYQVAAALSGEEAIRLAREKKFQIAFVDVKMQVMDGLETCLRLRELNSSLETIMMTAYRDEVRQTLEKAKAASVVTCLYKPFDVGKVMHLVKPEKVEVVR